MRVALYEQGGFPRGEQDYAAGEHGNLLFSISWAVAARVKVPLTNDRRARSRRTSASAFWSKSMSDVPSNRIVGGLPRGPVRRCGA